ncbi:PSMD6 [Enterospora canceri]|uniref:PSMD6 n=1 Tax=Enterospora canceri TaxID=1081671 RepID=A0A1Y1S8Y0_9MICR|nr:PSMD6 [Enterospora canceri]
MLEIDFAEPKLDILKMLSTSFQTKDHTAIEKYLIENGASAFYDKMVAMNLLKSNSKLRKKIEAAKEQKLNEIKNKNRNELDTEDAIKDYISFYAKAFDLDNFKSKVNELLEIDRSNSLLLDIQFCLIRMALILGDKKMLHENIEKGKDIATVSDWDRKNRFKVYLGLYSLQKAKFREAADYFYDCLASFEASETVEFEEIILYLIFSGLLSYSRNELEKKVVNNFEVLKFKDLIKLPEAFYNCSYPKLFDNLLEFVSRFENDIFIGDYKQFFTKEMVIKSYAQFLLSYQSVHLKAMADVFGVTERFLEEDLRMFIISNRLNCEIDKVDNLIAVKGIECTRTLENEFVLSHEIMKDVRKYINK